MEVCKTQNCTGCMACMNSCPRDAIQQKQNERGFYIPVVDDDRCVSCGLCQRICPANSFEKQFSTPEVFACWNANEEVRRYSTSGGMFTLFGEAILEQGGVVFGAVFDPTSAIVQHQMARTMNELRAMVGSKYVQSQIGNTYREVKKELDTGKSVLFSGTPCQCAGLSGFLQGHPNNLYLLDVVCHGVPSPYVLKSYISSIARNTPITNICFREKTPSWELFSMKLSFEGRSEYINDRNTDPYLRLFLGNYDLNQCCHDCLYATSCRCGDVTLGDFWGYLSESRTLRDNNKGISLLLVNSSKGKALFESVKQKAVYTAKLMDEALSGNTPLSFPTPRAVDSNVFWNEFLNSRDIATLSVLKKPPVHTSLKHRVRLCIDRNFYLLPTSLKKKYRRMKIQNAERKRNAQQ